MVEAKERVCITGVSGYLGSHVCLAFLKNGGFSIRGTVRDPANKDKLAPLKRAYGDELYSQIEFVKAELLDQESLDAAIAGCTYVVHTASPIPIKVPEDENLIIKPAVEGTLSVLRAAHKHKVKRVVITSSGLTVYTRKPENQKELYNEEDWSDIEVCGPYEKSKIMAERAAWDFLDSLPEAERFELTVIIPTLILGPPLVEGDFYSGFHLKNMLLGLWPGVPKVMMAVVDVRNVAHAHL
jgi:nucleoside-diphosphate-sugar epimerase